jgi:glycosyltransferase involved in cell wall biosynthesis
MRSNGNERPTVGIVTRTKNRSVLLRRAIESVIHQTYPDWRMVIVNDGGDPGETEFLAGHYAEAAAGRIRIIHNPKSLGMEGASKVGLEAIDSDLLILHDDDDSWSPEFLSVAVNELQHMQKKFPSTQGVTTYSHVVWETVRGNLVEILSCEPFNEWVPPGFLSLDRMLAGNFIPPISFLFTRKAYQDVGSVYEVIPYLGDWDFLVRLLCRFDVYMIPQFLAFYHWRQGSEPGALSNTVTAEIDQHRFYHQQRLNAWLREDFASGRFGAGTYANLRMHLETLITRPYANPPSSPAAAGGRTGSIPWVLPFGMMDAPLAADTLRGTAQMNGWALAEGGVKEVIVYVDRTYAGAATLGISRPDVVRTYPAFSNQPNSGWTAQLDTSTYSPGTHQLTVQATSNNGATRDLATISVRIVKP